MLQGDAGCLQVFADDPDRIEVPNVASKPPEAQAEKAELRT